MVVGQAFVVLMPEVIEDTFNVAHGEVFALK